MVVILIAALVTFAGLAALVTSDSTLKVDVAILSFIHDHANDWLNIFFSFITNLGDPIILVPFGLITCGILLRKQRSQQALVVAAMLAGTGVLTSVAKTIFDRARPDLWSHLTMESSFSFPSGHASSSFIIAVSLYYILRAQRRILIYVLPVYLIGIGLSRLYLGVHYPTDILGGWLLAAAWTAGVLLFVKFVSSRSRV